MKKNIFILFAFIILIVSCDSDRLGEGFSTSDNGGITFFISTPVSETPWQTRSENGDLQDERVTNLHYLIADANGKVLPHYFGKLSDDLSQLKLDGLVSGKYSIVFLASSKDSELAEISDPEILDDTWLSNTISSLPLEGSYFFKKLDFSVGLDPAPLRYEVVLDHASAKIKIEFPGLRDAVENMISSIKLSLDNDSHVYSLMSADGNFSGESTISDYELRDSLFNVSLNTFPSDGPLSGTVRIKSATLSGDSISTTYRFEGINAEAGKISTISINLRHPDFNTGYIVIRPQDYADYDADLMFMEDEPLAVLHNKNHRFFYMTNLLHVKTWENQLRVQLYSALPAKNIDVYANIPSLGVDSVRLVHFDRVEPLLDMMVPMTFTEREAEYYDIHGKRVRIPKTSTIPSDIVWYIKTDDPVLTRMETISLKLWKVCFPSWETIFPSQCTVPVQKSMRHAFVNFINLALTFESEEFAEEIAAREGTYIDTGVYLTNEEIIRRIHENYGGNYGLGAANPSSGAVGWGGGWAGGNTMLTMLNSYFEQLYPTVNPTAPLSGARTCFFHEHGHCLNFSHNGNMTYGNTWIMTVGMAWLRAHAAGKIIFYTPDFVNNIPYKREDAPKWANPRFAPKEEAIRSARNNEAYIPSGDEIMPTE